MHAATSFKNPLKTQLFADYDLEYAKYYPYTRQFSPPHANPISNHTIWQLNTLVYETIPTKMAKTFARITGNKKLLKSAQMLDTAQKKIQEMQSLFHFFITNTWIFESKIDEAILRQMSPEEKKEFRFDMQEINWRKALAGYCFGIRRFYFKEDCLMFEDKFEQILAQNQYEWFHDFTVVLLEAILGDSKLEDAGLLRPKLFDLIDSALDRIVSIVRFLITSFLLSIRVFLLRRSDF